MSTKLPTPGQQLTDDRNWGQIINSILSKVTSARENDGQVDGHPFLQVTLPTVNSGESHLEMINDQAKATITLANDGHLNFTNQVATGGYHFKKADNSSSLMSLDKDGNLVVEGEARVAKTLNVGGNTALAGTLNVAKNVTISENLTVSKNIGITENLNVGGEVNIAKDLSIEGKTTTSTLEITTGAGVGKVLVSNQTGQATWQTLAENKTDPAGSNNQIQFNQDGNFGASNTLVWDNENSRLGVGTTTPTQKLHVVGDSIFEGNSSISENLTIAKNTEINGILTVKTGANFNNYLNVEGKTKTRSLQIVSGAGVGKILTSDSEGNASWTSPTNSISGVTSFNDRSGAVTLTGGDVTEALDYVPVNKAGDTLDGSLTLVKGTNTLAPLKLQSGVNLTELSFGSVEFDGTNLFLTNNLESPTRKTIAYVDSDISGNAATSSRLQNTRTIAASGDATWQVSFDGSSNVTGDLTLANSGVTAGTYPKVTVDAKGRVTNGTTLIASDIPNLDAAKITSGLLDIARIPTGSTGSTVALGNHNHDNSYLPLAGGTLTGNLAIANQGELRLNGLTANGVNYVAIKSNPNLATNFALTLPAALGSNGQVLTTDANGNLSWSTISTGATALSGLSDVTITTINSGQFLRFNGTKWVNDTDGSTLNNLNASNVSSGTLPDARLSNNVALLTGTQTFSGIKSFSSMLTAVSFSSDTTGRFENSAAVYERRLLSFNLYPSSTATLGYRYQNTGFGSVLEMLSTGQVKFRMTTISASTAGSQVSTLVTPLSIDIDETITCSKNLIVNGTITSTSPTTGALVVDGGAGIAGISYFGNEIRSTSNNCLRSIAGNFGAFLRNDGTNFYFLLTNSGDQTGTWNAFRPLTVNLSTGNVSTNGILQVSNTTTSISSTTGALTVAGGIGITENLNVGGGVGIIGALRIGGKTTTSTLQVTTGAASGRVLTSDASGNAVWVAPAASTTNPAGSNTQIQFNNNGVFGASGNLVWDNVNNRLGIDDTNPSAKLSVVSGTEIVGTTFSTIMRVSAGTIATAVASELNIASFGGLTGTHSVGLSTSLYKNGATADWQNTALLLNYDVDNGKRAGGYISMYNGNVGIGTIAPTQKLTVDGGNIGLDNTRSIVAKDTTGTYRTALIARWSNDALYLDGGSGGAYLRTNNGTVTNMYLATSGNVGIATTTPTERLDVVGSIKASVYVFANYLNTTQPIQAVSSFTVKDFPIRASDNFIRMVSANDTRSALGVGPGALFSVASGATAIPLASTTSAHAGLEIRSVSNANAPGGFSTAHITFHRAGSFASNFGLDTDNQFAFGGWTSGAGYTPVKTGTLLAYGNIYNSAGYMYPGRTDISGGQQNSWYLGSQISFGLYTNGGFQAVGNLLLGGNIQSINGQAPTNGAIRMQSHLHLNAMPAQSVIVNWNSGAGTANDSMFKVGNGESAEIFNIYRSGNVSIGGSITSVNSIVSIGGYTPANAAIRLTPNMHINSGVGSCVYLNWDSGAGTATNAAFIVGNGAGTPLMTVRYNGTTSINTAAVNSNVNLGGTLALSVNASGNGNTAGVCVVTSYTNITLPASSSCSGRLYYLRNLDPNNVITVIITTNDSILSSTTGLGLVSSISIPGNKTVTLISTGSSWLQLN